MHKPFFPDPVFGWSFVAVLMVLLAIASLIDVRTARIPKSVTLTTAACGLLANIVRGSWLGHQGRELWLLDTGSIWLGALDGFLFALLGLVFAFIVFFGMWMLGSCAGGDVKLCAAIGAWIGALYTVFLLLTTVPVLVIWTVGKMAVSGTSPLAEIKKAHKPLKGKPKEQLPRFRMTFSVTAAISTAAVMLWFYRFDLQLTPAPPAPEQEAKHASAGSTEF